MRRCLPVAAFLAALLVLPPPALCASQATRDAAAASALFSRAEADFAALRANAKAQRLRQNFTRVLDAYRKVFEKYPATRQGEKSLMRAGELFTLLFRWTGQEADLNQAQNYYQRLVQNSPDSALADDALLAVAYIYLYHFQDPAQAWLRFREVTLQAPKGNKTGEARRQLKRLARFAPASKPAPTAEQVPAPAPTVIAAPPPTVIAMPAPPVITAPPESATQTAQPAAAPSAAGTQPARNRVLNIRHWSNPEYSRVVIDLDRQTNFYSNLLEDRAGSGRAPRLYVDLFTSVVEAQVCNPISVNDGILHGIRAGQHTPDTVRVVLDIDGLRTYRIFPMANPFRIVIDVTGGAPGDAAAPSYAHDERPAPDTTSQVLAPATVPALIPMPPATQPDVPPAPAAAPPPRAPRAAPPVTFSGTTAEPAATAALPAVPPPARTARVPPFSKPADKPSLARQLGLGVHRVVIDAGHGAHDTGAIGVDGLQEKDVTLDLALRVGAILKAAGYETVLTRDKDVYLPLEERTAIANTARGDLFLSLHCNASDAGNLSGVETYYLNLASSVRSMRTAARENSMAVANMSDLQQIVREIQNSKMDESSQFAARVQLSLHDTLRRKYPSVKNLGVKQAPFYVLIGAQMPSILAEVSFINHWKEGRLLSQSAYRELIAQAIADGVKRYARSVKNAALPAGRKKL